MEAGRRFEILELVPKGDRRVTVITNVGRPEEALRRFAEMMTAYGWWTVSSDASGLFTIGAHPRLRLDRGRGASRVFLARELR